jgi:hypothetical protein
MRAVTPAASGGRYVPDADRADDEFPRVVVFAQERTRPLAQVAGRFPYPYRPSTVLRTSRPTVLSFSSR